MRFRLLAAFLTFFVAALALKADNGMLLRNALNAQNRIRPVPLDSDSIILQLERQPLDPIEGLWQLTENASTVVITRSTNTSLPFYVIQLVDSPDRLIPSGTVLAVISPGASDTFEGVMYGDVRHNGTMKSPGKFTLRMTDRNSLTFNFPKTSINFNPFGLIPYPLRHVFRYGKSSPQTSHGAKRIYPILDSAPSRIVYF